MSKPKHYDGIIKMFEPFYEPWMSDIDKHDLVCGLAATINKTFDILSDEIDIGIALGVSIDKQVEVSQRILRGQR